MIDESFNNRASAIAAGLFNPVTGKMMTKTWRADHLFPYLEIFYTEAEKMLQAKFYHPFPLYRPFISIEEQNEWMGKSAEPEMMDYIERVFTSSTFSGEVNDPFGGLLLKGCGYLSVPLFMKSLADFLAQTDSLRRERFEEKHIAFVDEKIRYGEWIADKVVFCSGTGLLQNGFFKNVPIRPLKGETLSVKIGHSLDRIYNRGVYVVPSQATGFYKVGATYSTKDKLEGITEEGRAELVEKLNVLLKIPFEEESQDWGFRPTTPDRRPILGSHFAHPNLVIFNGLGTKGVSLAPFFSRQLADWMEGVSEIDKLVDITRYY